ncbi:DNA-directed RNA polymerase [archaeon]|nr:DNA-directed RNA polymerase [archaeon]
MFYELKVKGHIRVPPKLFNEDVEAALKESLIEQFEGYISKEIGIVIGILDVLNVGEGVVIPGDGAPYYETTFSLLSFKPEIQEAVLGKVSDITDFGAFINLGPLDGMVHISQAMDDNVTFSKSKVLMGKDTKYNLKVGDTCRARIVAVSFKDPSNPKIGLTMRQHRLGALQWIEEQIKKERKEGKEEKKEK